MIRIHRAALAACLVVPSFPVASNMSAVPAAATGTALRWSGVPAVATAVSDVSGPPVWLRPGVVITYVLGQTTLYAADPTKGEDASSASGAGFSQIMVTHVNQKNVLVVVDSYGTRPTDPYVSAISSDAMIMPAADSEYWKNPGVLAQGAAPGGSAVTRGNYKIGGTSYDAVTLSDRTSYAKDQNTSVTSVSTSTYDAKSGLSLAATWDSVTERKGTELQSTHGYSELRGVRATKFPWSGVPAGTWKAPFRTLEVQVHKVTSVPGIGDMTGSGTVVVGVAQQGPDFVVYRINARGQAQDPATGTSFAAGGPAVLDPVWMPPSALATLQKNQVLDTDPRTKRRISVGSVQPASVTIFVDLPGEHREVTYDRTSGIATRTVLTQQSSFDLVTTEMTVVGRT